MSKTQTMNYSVLVILFCLVMIIAVTRFMLFLDSNMQNSETDQLNSHADTQTNQMTQIIEDGFLK